MFSTRTGWQRGITEGVNSLPIESDFVSCKIGVCQFSVAADYLRILVVIREL